MVDVRYNSFAMKNMVNRLLKAEQMSDALLLSLFLAFSGGFQDAYTYIARGHVFANAQTGNIVLMSTNLLSGKTGDAIRYLLPLAAFAFGVLAADVLRAFHKGRITGHWRQTVILAEMAVLFSVGWMPETWNTFANMLVSFACAMQVEAFRKVNGKAYASTMCIGNIRAGMSGFSDWLLHHDRSRLSAAFDYLLVIFIFACGAGIGGVLSSAFDFRIIWICLIFLAVSYVLMLKQPKGAE